MNKIIYPYRFKTEQEFITIFGYDWYEYVEFGWNDSMTEFCGKVYPFIINKSFESDDLPSFEGWNISWDMLTENIPNYKPKRIIYE